MRTRLHAWAATRKPSPSATYASCHQVIPTGGALIVLMTLHVPYPATNWPPAN